MNTEEGKIAVEWVERAKSFCTAVGKDIALAEFTSPKGRFSKNQLYIYVLDLDGFMLAHGMNPWFNGKNFLQVKDSTGNPFVKQIIDEARLHGSGWVEYKWFDSVRQSELSKHVYFELFQDMVICCGIYDESPPGAGFESS